jgi:hypothetical protein
MRTRLIARALVGLSIVYLAIFVPRGWIPHDEGMIGQSAERVLIGERPHVDYEEPYTGGLTRLHALVFKVAGVDLIYARWLLFAGAVLAQVLIYLILRRFLEPIGAAVGAWLALGWSFPNYFAALPSWWVLICALACVWAFLRFVDTGLLRYAAAAGFAAGLSILIKQTGLYVLVALVMALLYDAGGDHRDTPVSWPGRLACASVAVAALGLAFMIVATRLSLSDLLYLFVPILACSRVLIIAAGRPVAAGAAIAAAALPLVWFITPYVIDQHVGQLVNGLFVLPQKRVQFASVELPPAEGILAGLSLLAIVMGFPEPPRLRALASRLVAVMVWLLAAVLVVASLYDFMSYHIVWQTVRSFGALLPVAICSLMLSGRVHDRTERRILFGVAAFLAWASLVQVPFSAPIYFCYVTPLAVIAGVALARNRSVLCRPAVGASTAVLLAFALLSMNRGYTYDLGINHRPFTPDESLNIKRASLRVSRADAVTYRRVVELIESHIGSGSLVAGPDAPEVYFLTGRFSPSGTLFDFFTDDVTAEGGLHDMPGLSDARVVVLNHARNFTQGPSAHLAANARRMFPNSEAVGTFEVRWR